MTTEEQYYYNKASQDKIYSDLQHESIMSTLLTNEQFAIMNCVGAKLFRDGDQWCCLYGENLQEGICGFGETPIKAVIDFNSQFYKN